MISAITLAGMAESLTNEKHMAKEVSRKEILDSIPKVLGASQTKTSEVQKMLKEKAAAIGKLVRPIKAKSPEASRDQSMEALALVEPRAVLTVTNAKKAKQTRAAKRKTCKTKKTVVEGNAKTQTQRGKNTMKLCGCRHGDLNAMKSFTKADAIYYSLPNRFLEGKSCVDCKEKTVLEMATVKRRMAAVVFYCDEGIKGFDAPKNDPMKAELTCDLILCPQCEAIRRITYDIDNSGGTGRKRKQRKQNTLMV